MRLCVFTDTLGDVNGVSRFIQNVASRALASGRELHVITSTNFNVPNQPNIHNLTPVYARRMPRYHNLEIVWPPARHAQHLLNQLNPDIIHLSTPGPIGWLGRRLARRARLPIVGIYHTDFPAYVEQLFHSRPLAAVCTVVMRRFHRPFARVITRSAAYLPMVRALGIPDQRLAVLQPGIETVRFAPTFRDPGIWARVGAPALAEPGVNVMVITRISIEKNMPVLVEAWKRLRPHLAARHLTARLVVVGDGPYRQTMQRLLDGPGDAFFLGFRHGAELAQLYATGDLFVFPSATDTLGQVVMEAQSSGLPAIVSDAGGPQEVIAPGQTGLVVHADDPDAWSGALLDLIADEPRRRAMSAAAAARLAPMTLAASFEHYWQLHERVLAEHR